MPNGTVALSNAGDPGKGNLTAFWGYFGPMTGGPFTPGPPTQSSSPAFNCGIYAQGGPAIVAVNFLPIPVVADASGDGILGFGATNGVHGVSEENGVTGFGNSGYGVYGTSNSNDGVHGESQSDQHAGVFGTSKLFDGVHGESQSSQHAGVSGINTAGGYGVYAQSVNQSVKGSPPGIAGIFLGNVEIQGDITKVNNIQGDVTVMGTLTAKVDVVLGSDCAEDFDIVASAEVDPGTVMVLTENGSLEPSQTAYDKKVAGVISGAGDYKPGLILGRTESSRDRLPLALAGKVYCKVDADLAPIAVGDLLTTSERAGFGMKATDSAQAFGAVLGKALKPLRAGQGMIPILVALQ